MEEELLLLQKEAGKCEEDVYLLLHYICNTFTKAETGFFYLLVRYKTFIKLHYVCLIKNLTNNKFKLGKNPYV